jgi:hypothetical protein
MLEHIDSAAADRIIESLRFGIPPADVIQEFTVGREDQLEALERTLRAGSPAQGGALLLKANYGSGKSHLLQLLRKIAIDAGFAVSHVEVNSQSGVRFNRMDTILGEVSRQLETDDSGKRGVGSLFDRFTSTKPNKLGEDARLLHENISSKGQWTFSETLRSPAVQVAIRAWSVSGGEVRDLVEDWFANPYNYRGQRKLLYQQLVESFLGKFKEVRSERMFYIEDVLVFHTGQHRQAWDAISDFDLIAKASGLRGLVLLFDEFEDVIHNLNRRDLQEQAYINLFRFFAGQRFPGMAYFAVTPDFVEKCTTELIDRGAYEFDYQQFKSLDSFEMDQISQAQVVELAKRIRHVHAKAYQWEADEAIPDRDLVVLVDELLRVPVPNRVRSAIQGVVSALDAAQEPLDD